MRALLAGLAPGLPSKVVAAVVGRADGIPLYAVEMVRMLVAQGRLVRPGWCLPAGRATSTRWTSRRRSSRSSRRASMACRPRTGRCSRTRRSSASRSRSPAWRRSSGMPGTEIDARLGLAGPARGAGTTGRPAFARARPVRVRPGAHPRGRVQHARARRPSDASPGGGALLRVARRRGAGGCPGRPVPRGLSELPEGAGGGRARGPGAGGAPRRGASARRRSARRDRRWRSCEQTLEVTHDAIRGGRYPRAGRCGGWGCRPGRRRPGARWGARSRSGVTRATVRRSRGRATCWAGRCWTRGTWSAAASLLAAAGGGVPLT